jgi:hypothetical protein
LGVTLQQEIIFPLSKDKIKKLRGKNIKNIAKIETNDWKTIFLGILFKNKPRIKGK